jgi:hypothetical protein
VIQKALEVMSRSSCAKLIEGLKMDTAEYIKSMHGNHVIQACIEKMPATSVSFVIDAIERAGAESMSAHMYACRVITRLLEHAQPGQMRNVLHEIFLATSRLAQDRYGNYVLQAVFAHCEIADRQHLFRHLRECGLQALARQKYAHNVIERCVSFLWSPEFDESALAAEREALAYEFLWKGDVPPIVMLVEDRFGTSVVQCLIDNIDRALTQQLLQFLAEKQEGMPEAAYGNLVRRLMDKRH